MKSKAGMTLMEVLVTILVAAFVLGALTTLFVNSGNAYSRARESAAMTRNADNLLQKLTDLLLQAGASLPKDDTAISVTSVRDITVKANTTNAYVMFQQTTSCQSVPVSKGAAFRGLSILRTRENSTPPAFVDLRIDRTYQAGSYVAGVDSVHDSIRLSATATFYLGDELYYYTSYHVVLDTTTGALMQTATPYGGTAATTLVSENVSAFAAVFQKSDGTTTNAWSQMTQCSLYVALHASRASPGKPNPRTNVLGKSRVFALRNRML